MFFWYKNLYPILMNYHSLIIQKKGIKNRDVNG